MPFFECALTYMSYSLKALPHHFLEIKGVTKAVGLVYPHRKVLHPSSLMCHPKLIPDPLIIASAHAENSEKFQSPTGVLSSR